MKIDLVLSGGGVKAFAFLGALKKLEENNLVVERAAGSSAGAIIAALYVAGYKASELEEMFLDLDLKEFLDAPFMNNKLPLVKWISLYFKKGLYKGDKLEKWLTERLANKGIKTFSDIKASNLKIIVSDVTLGELIVIPDDIVRVYGINPNTFSVARAVRMSASFPYFFMPKKLRRTDKKASYLIDGGLLSNFPLWVFRQRGRNQRPVLGVTLSDDTENNEGINIRNALDMLHGLLSTMLQAHDSRYISKAKKPNIIFIPVKKIKAMHLNLTVEEKTMLITLGKETTRLFLKRWP